MDIFLSAEARKVLESLAVLSKNARPAGFLIGHVRGGRFFIESAVGGGDADWAAPETYERLDRIHPGRIVGFFVFSQAAAARRPAARPHACGKAVLAIKKSGGGLDMRGFLVDYNRRFEFVPIEVRREKEARP